MEKSTPIHLRVPDREPAGTGSFDYRRRSVQEWLENLPVANLGLTSRHVFESLQACNRLELHPSVRLHYLEQLREIVRYIGDGLRKHYLGRELPLHSKPKRIVKLAIRLLQEMALGYEVLIETAGEFPGMGFSRRNLACALDRAIRYRSRVLLESWLVYQAPPEDTWLRLHDLYTIAEANELAEQRVTDSQLNSGSHRSTPGQAYLQILLLAAAGPQRMYHSEILDAYRLLEHWAPAAQLVAPDSPEASEAVFHVPRSLDEPPQPLTIGRQWKDDRLLVTDPLLRVIDRELSTTTAKGMAFWRRKPLADIHPELSQRLLLALGAVVGRRRQSRLKIKSHVHAVLGLSAIHQVLCRELGQDSGAADPVHERFQSREIHPPKERETDVWDLIYPAELMKLMAEEEQHRSPDVRHKLRHEDILDWDLINVSAGGYCLVSGPQQSLRAHVGELIAMREISDRGLPWQLGAVRWIRTMPEQRLQIGVQILAPAPCPIQLCAEHSDQRFGPLERALLLPAVTVTDQPPTLIVPGRHYALERLARVRYGQRETIVRLNREVDATAHYAQFEFRNSDELEADMQTLSDIVPTS